MDKGILAVAAAGSAAIFGIVVYHDTHCFTVRHYTVSSEKLRRDTRLVVLADLHDQVYGEHNERLLRAIDREKPDIVLCTGDLITAHWNPDHERTDVAASLVMTLSRRYPVLLINGNHETKLDRVRSSYGRLYDDYQAMVFSAGGVILRNESALFADRGLTVTGLELPLRYFRHFDHRMPSAKALQKRIGQGGGDSFRILLAHHPDFFASYRDWGADLILSGHIHGGIVRFPFLGGILSPTGIPFPRYSAGMYRADGSTMIVSRGLGTHTIPVRLFNPGELTVVDCRAV